MNKHNIPGTLLAFLAALAFCGPAQGTLFRAYLASDGSDGNPCTLPAPCRLLPAALTAVADGGEIWMLDSANFNTGPVNVTKSVTMLAIPGAVGSILALGGDAFVINTGGVKLTLRNIVIAPFPGGGGTNGINMTNGAALTLEGCLIANLPQSGIVVNTGAAASVRITDTTIRDNGTHALVLMNGARATVTRAMLSGNSGGSGVYVYGHLASTTTTADIADTTLDANSAGVQVSSDIASAVVKVSVRDSRAVRNTTYGLFAESLAGASVTLSTTSNVASNNGIGIAASSAGAAVWAAGNTVSDNSIGLSNSGALFESASNNAVRNNATPTSGAITPISLM